MLYWNQSGLGDLEQSLYRYIVLLDSLGLKATCCQMLHDINSKRNLVVSFFKSPCFQCVKAVEFIHMAWLQGACAVIRPRNHNALASVDFVCLMPIFLRRLQSKEPCSLWPSLTHTPSHLAFRKPWLKFHLETLVSSDLVADRTRLSWHQGSDSASFLGLWSSTSREAEFARNRQVMAFCNRYTMRSSCRCASISWHLGLRAA